jgi:G protein-coupled receptor Mth (Methuselah protein)
MCKKMTSLLFCFCILFTFNNTLIEAINTNSRTKDYDASQGPINKCCPLNQVFNVTHSECQDGMFQLNLVKVWNITTSYNLTEVDIRNVILKHDQLTQEDCLGYGRRLLDPEVNEDEYKLLNDGRLWLPNVKYYYNPSPQEYCIEIFRAEDADTILRVAVCNIDRKVEHPEDEMCEVRLVVFPILLFLSSVALFLTILVYGIIPEFKNLPGKILLCLSLTLLGAMSILLLIQLIGSIDVIPKPFCTLSAVLLQFFFLSSFSWMTVMSFDICQTFRSLNSNGRHLYRTESKNIDQRMYKTRFLFYSLCAWGGPMVSSALTFVLDSELMSNSWLLKPRFGETSCWFYGDLEILIYFYGPIAVLILVNLAMFLSTVRFLSVFQEKMRSKSTALRKHSVAQTAAVYSQGRERLELYARVFVIMGVSWVFEIVVSKTHWK